MEDHYSVPKDLMPYARAYESLGDAVTMSDPSDRLVFINSAGAELYGYDRNELVGRPLSTIFPAGAQFVGTATLQASPNEKWEGEVKRSRKSGEEFPAQLTVTLLRNEDDEVIGTAGIVRDLTEQHRLADENAVIAEVGRIIGSTLDIDDVYERFASEVGKLIPCDRIGIGIPDAAQEYNTIAYMSGFQVVAGRKRGDRLAMEGTLAQQVVQSTSTVLIQGVTRGHLEVHAPGLLPNFDKGIRSFLGLPLMHHDRLVGVLQIFSKQMSAYSERHVTMAERVGSQVAGAIANSLLYAQLQYAESEQRRLAEENAVLVEVGRIIGSTLDIDEVYERFASEVGKLIPFDRLGIGIPDSAREYITLAYVSGVQAEGVKRGDRAELAGTLARQAIHGMSSVLIQGVTREHLEVHVPGLVSSFDDGLRSFLSVPLAHHDRLVGVIAIFSKQTTAYTERHVALAERVGNQIAGALANSLLYTRLQDAETEQRRLAEEQAVLAEIGRIIASSLSIDEVYEQCAEKISTLIPSDRVGVDLVDVDKNVMMNSYVSGMEIPDQELLHSMPLEGTFGAAAMVKGLVIRLDEVPDFETLYPGAVASLRVGVKSFLGVPLRARDKVIGALVLQSINSNAYDENSLELAQRVADQMSGAIANAQLHGELGEQSAERAVLAEIGRIISSSLDIGYVYERFAEQVQRLIPCERHMAGEVNVDRNTLRETYCWGIDVPGRQPDDMYPLVGTISEVAVRARSATLITGVPETLAKKFPSLVPTLECGLRSFLAVPLIVRDEVIGILHIRSTNPDAYTEHHVTLAQRVGDQIAGAIANAQLHRDLRQEAEERRLAQIALTQSEERNRAIVEAIPDLIFRVRGDGTFLDYQGAKDEFSLPAEVWLGKRVSDVLPPDVAELATQSINRAILTAQVQEFEYTLPVHDGEMRDWEGRTVKAGDEEVLILVRDITERKLLSAELLQAQKMEAVGTLAGGVAHDFNNMLTAITGYTDLAAVTPGIPGHVRGYLDEVRKASDRAASLTRQLLTFSRRQIVNRKVIDLNDVILDMDKMLRRLIREDIELVTLPAEDLRLVQADPGHIEQMLMNMAVNASDAMPEGGKLVVKTLNVDVDDILASQHGDLSSGDYVGLIVRDTGEGMTEEVRSRAFEPFFTTKEVGKGTGLGLSTVHGIVTQIGGAITVESEQGVGTTLRVLLPAVTEDKEDLPLRGEVGFLPIRSETILLVEDEPLVRGVAAEVLRHQGYKVIESANGVEALEEALKADEPIDLLVTDLVMPLMGGKELADRFRESRPDIKVLYSTGYSEDTTLIRELAADGSSLLQKPFGPTELAEWVRLSLDGP